MTAPNNSLATEAPIFLVGFMGAGKTTVGRALAALLRYKFYDLDELVEERAGKTVQAIFDEQGESEFRRLEREALLSCNGMVRTVIAPGGGAYVSEENRTSLRGFATTVWLACPLEVCLGRMGGDPSRPLLGSEDEMRLLLEQRRPAYAEADFVIHAGDLSPERLAREIRRILQHAHQ